MTISDEAKAQVAAVLKSGEVAIDATMGNGWDTLFLAEKVGETGRVFAFDVQEAALVKTGKRLTKAGVAERCQLLRKGHEEMAEFVPNGVGAVMFNFGYLPYADREVITHRETSLRALKSAAVGLRIGGVITLVCYRGHAGGAEEAAAIHEWALAQEEVFEVIGPRVLPASESPFLLVLVRRK